MVIGNMSITIPIESMAGFAFYFGHEG